MLWNKSEGSKNDGYFSKWQILELERLTVHLCGTNNDNFAVYTDRKNRFKNFSFAWTQTGWMDENCDH